MISLSAVCQQLFWPCITYFPAAELLSAPCAVFMKHTLDIESWEVPFDGCEVHNRRYVSPVLLFPSVSRFCCSKATRFFKHGATPGLDAGDRCARRSHWSHRSRTTQASAPRSFHPSPRRRRTTPHRRECGLSMRQPCRAHRRRRRIQPTDLVDACTKAATSVVRRLRSPHLPRPLPHPFLTLPPSPFLALSPRSSRAAVHIQRHVDRRPAT
ncbi:hypothetical protein DFH06DRAFT_1163083 [Mycena polygramma]|nr:hypothetical protein DFH06DRAFT_1163083 [Mycena polygramma]